MVNTENATLASPQHQGSGRVAHQRPQSHDGRGPFHGVSAMPSLPWSILFDSGGAAGWSSPARFAQTNELLLNGAPDALGTDGCLSPPQDAVQEVRVQSLRLPDAAFGIPPRHTQPDHQERHQHPPWLRLGVQSTHTLTANDFFLNKAAPSGPSPLQPVRRHRWRTVYVPHFIDTRNKVFWFFAWEASRTTAPPFTGLCRLTP